MSVLSPQVSVTSPDGASVPPTTTRRRGLSYLRELAQSRLGGGSASDSRSSPRPTFSRSTSYNESRTLLAESGRRRSISRPNEHTATVNTLGTSRPDNRINRALVTTSASRRARSLSRKRSEEAANQAAQPDSENMARHRHSTKRTLSNSGTGSVAANGHTAPNGPVAREEQVRRTRERPSDSTGDSVEVTEKGKLPTIRFLPHSEIRNGRQSLNFAPISRTLPNETCIIPVGRYSEREGIPITNPTMPSDAPVGFKSKVVSRKHCEFSYLDGQWQVKDSASSSGTFLNHIRLSQPNAESRLYPVKDGDILQLGIDFRGGEEMIFRCVKIRIECNRSWQKRPNNYNKTRHAQLQSLTKETSANENTGECAICLNAIHPIQALFVAPCAHVWHYKCIRPVLEGKNSTFPNFNCPNCRAYSDLSAEVDIEPEDSDEDMSDVVEAVENKAIGQDQTGDPGHDRADAESVTNSATTENQELSNEQQTRRSSMSGSGLLARRQASNRASIEVNSVNGLDMPQRFDADETTNELRPEITRTDSPDAVQGITGEGPLTPRNNAGPFVFDGSAGRPGSTRRLTVTATDESED